MNRDEAIESLATVLSALEPTLDRSQIKDAVDTSLASKIKAHRLLESVHADPEQLTNGSDEMDPSLGRIIRELSTLGAQKVQKPRCYQCRQTRLLPARVGSHRICATCYKREKMIRIQCSQCGQLRQRRTEISGRFWCGACWEQLLPTAHETLLNTLQNRIPGITDRQAAQAAHCFSSSKKPGEILRTALELDLNSAQWLANPSTGSSLFVRLHAAIRSTGAVLAPLVCGLCGTQPPTNMRNLIDGMRCCDRCHRQSQQGTCTHCGRVQIIAARTVQGDGICQTCKKKLPENMDQCSICGSLRYVAWQSSSGPVCSVCRPKQLIDICAKCRQRKPCLFAGTPEARCHECSKSHEECGQCGKIQRVSTRRPDGTPICHTCGRPRDNCTNCGKNRKVIARVHGAAWCEYCYKRNEVSHHDCVRCSKHERLFSTGLCLTCSAEVALESFFPTSLRSDNPIADAIYESYRSAKPSVVLKLSRTRTAPILKELMNSPEKLNHEYLDTTGSDALTRGIRSLLIDAGLLEPRDHHLARFASWILESSKQIVDPKLRTAFITFARWRHFRELGNKPSPISTSLAVNRRRELRLVLELISWLQKRGKEFESLTQADIDHWRSYGSKEKYRVKEFLRWAHQNKLVGKIEIRRPPRTALNVIGFSDEQRTEILRTLLAEHCPESVVTRFSALLVLLFGARPSQITRLKVSDIFFRAENAYLRLGSEPVLLPDALAHLANVILNDRAVSRQLSTLKETPWLLPGTISGSPITATTLAKRLRRIGVPASTGRTSAMSMLAQELPPTFVARLTGTSASTAIRWMDAVAASNARYAALRIAEEDRSEC